MDFVSCKREAHRDWGANDPINLDHVVTYGAGTVRPRQNSTRSEAPAIVFTTVRGLPITWSFVDERHRDWELGRLQELTYVPKDSGILAELIADRPQKGFIGLQKLLMGLRETNEELLAHMAQGFGIGPAELSAIETGRLPVPDWLPAEISKIYKIPVDTVLQAVTETTQRHDD